MSKKLGDFFCLLRISEFWWKIECDFKYVKLWPHCEPLTTTSSTSSLFLTIITVHTLGLFIATFLSTSITVLLTILFFSSCQNITDILCVYSNVRYVMEFLAWWVLKSKVFAQKSTVVKWNYYNLWIDIEWSLQKLGLI